MRAGKHLAPILGDEDQMDVEFKNAVPSCSDSLFGFHRPSIFEAMKQTKTLKVRVKDKHAAELNRMARSVNFVWNYLNELSSRAIREKGLFLSAYDMHPYTKGAGKDLGLHSQTLQCIAAEYVARRKQFKKPRLNWRKSGGVRPLTWLDSGQYRRGQVEERAGISQRHLLQGVG